MENQGNIRNPDIKPGKIAKAALAVAREKYNKKTPNTTGHKVI